MYQISMNSEDYFFFPCNLSKHIYQTSQTQTYFFLYHHWLHLELNLKFLHLHSFLQIQEIIATPFFFVNTTNFHVIWQVYNKDINTHQFEYKIYHFVYFLGECKSIQYNKIMFVTPNYLNTIQCNPLISTSTGNKFLC